MNNFVTVVSGLPRSGTSMMMQILRAGGMPVLTDDIRRANIDNPYGYLEFERVKSLPRESAWLDDALGKAVKMTCALLCHLPSGYEYRVLFMDRNLEEVVASQNVMLQRREKNLGKPQECDAFVTLFSKHLEQVRAWLAQQRHFKVLTVRHADVLERPRPTAESISRFLNADLDLDAMAEVPDASLYRQRVQHQGQ